MYPFPTVCADKQSTDWFHAISRTLKWNERERQKSFVVVEEGRSQAKPKKRSKRATLTGDGARPKLVDEDDDEEDTSESEEEDTYDIDDSSVETDASPRTAQSEADKVGDMLPKTPIVKRRIKSRSRSRSRPPSSGIDSPGRFATPHHAQPQHRRVEFHTPHSPPYTAESSPDSAQFSHPNNQMTPVDMHHSGPKHASSTTKTRPPREREMDMEAVKTPTLPSLVHNRTARARSRSRPRDQESRAFAVWGQDESSDGTASDNDA